MIGVPANTEEVVRVSPGRLASGFRCHKRNRQIGEGDIKASYSADVIAMDGRVRKPFRLTGWLRVTTSICGTIEESTFEAYRLMPITAFDGTVTTYAKRAKRNGGEDARSDPLGFYHGMSVTHAKTVYVLTGPPIAIMAGEPEPEQADLFGS